MKKSICSVTFKNTDIKHMFWGFCCENPFSFTCYMLSESCFKDTIWRKVQKKIPFLSWNAKTSRNLVPSSCFVSEARYEEKNKVHFWSWKCSNMKKYWHLAQNINFYLFHSMSLDCQSAFSKTKVDFCTFYAVRITFKNTADDHNVRPSCQNRFPFTRESDLNNPLVVKSTSETWDGRLNQENRNNIEGRTGNRNPDSWSLSWVSEKEKEKRKVKEL